MDESSKKLLLSRKATLLDETTEQMGRGKDLMTVLRSCTDYFLHNFRTLSLIDAVHSNMRGKAENAMPDSHLLGHINALIFGAVDTASSAFSRLLHLLAQNPDMQERIRQEGRLAREKSGTEELEFKVLTNMTYTNAFIREVLRL